MRSLSLVIFLSLLSTSLFSQKKPHFIITVTGDSIPANTLKYKSPMFKSSYLLIDGEEKFDISAVKIYQNEDGYYKKFTSHYGDGFFERTLEGDKIEGYSQLVTTYNANPGYGYGGGYGSYSPGFGGSFSKSKVYYYSKNGTSLKKMNLSNLKLDLADNPQSMASLQKVKNRNILDAVLYTAGAAMIIAGIASIDVAGPGEVSQNSGTQISPFFILGAVTISVPWLIKGGKIKLMEQAIHSYNNN